MRAHHRCLRQHRALAPSGWLAALVRSAVELLLLLPPPPLLLLLLLLVASLAATATPAHQRTMFRLVSSIPFRAAAAAAAAQRALSLSPPANSLPLHPPRSLSLSPYLLIIKRFLTRPPAAPVAASYPPPAAARARPLACAQRSSSSSSSGSGSQQQPCCSSYMTMQQPWLPGGALIQTFASFGDAEKGSSMSSTSVTNLRRKKQARGGRRGGGRASQRKGARAGRGGGRGGARQGA